ADRSLHLLTRTLADRPAQLAGSAAAVDQRDRGDRHRGSIAYRKRVVRADPPGRVNPLVAGFPGGQAADTVISRHAIGVKMNATLDRMAVQAAVNPAALHILSRNLDVLGELRALDTTRAFGAQIEAYLLLEGEQLDHVLE